MHALEVRHLKKSFGKVKAVDDASFNVPEGAVFGLIGRNGAGKTTTIRMMMNIYIPDSGDVILRGAPVTEDFKQKVGYLPEERGLYKKMNVWDTLMFFAEVKGKTGKDIERKANEYLKRFQLIDRKTSKVQDLSKGNQQKIQFIATILHDPEFLILDEPFSGLDPINTDLLRQIIIDLKNQGKVIIFSTHLMDFAEKMCDHIAMIDHGQIILHGSLKDIKAKYGHRNVNLTHDGDISFLKNSPIIESIQDFGNSTGITVKEESQTQDLLKLLLEKDVKIRKFNANDISLHEVFVKLAGDDNTEVAHV
jgi:ABC-2 type transport system ATP-binding protein